MTGVPQSSASEEADWAQRYFADSGVITPEMKIEKVRILRKDHRGTVLKFTFQDATDVKTILRNKKLLKSSTKWQRIFINESKSRYQRLEEGKMRWFRREQQRHLNTNISPFLPDIHPGDIRFDMIQGPPLPQQLINTHLNWGGPPRLRWRA